MSVLGAESYAAVCHLVTDVETLSREERNHVLWYACDGGDLSLVKSVIRAGCDVDHFHRDHTPLMMASIRGHDDVVKELILAGCKVDLRSRKCSVDWFTLITKKTLAWPVLVGLAVALLFMKVVPMMFVNILGYWLLVITITLHFLSEDSFKVSWVLRMKTRTKCIAWAGIVLPAVLAVWRMVGTAMSVSQLLLQATVLVALVAMTLLVTVTAVTGIGGRTQLKEVKVTGAIITATVVAVAMLGIRACGGPYACVGAATGALVAVTGLVAAGRAGVVAAVVEVAVTVTATVAAIEAVIAIWTWIPAHTTLGTSAVTSAMAVIRTLVLVFSLTVADTREHFTGVMILILAVIGDTVLIPTEIIWPIASMLPVIVLLALTPIGALRRMSTTSISGMTALHYAAWYDHITCGTHLVEAGANVLLGNNYFRTPLHICSHGFRDAVQRVQPHPPKQVIAVIGNTEYGKSTLIAALQNESRTCFQSLVYKLAQVYDITQRTTGIETVSFSSAKYGDILFYDFAGQFEYHGPHQPFLEAMLHKPGVSVTMLLLVKATEERAVITQQLIRWLQAVTLISTPSTPHVIVVGSFLDQAKSKEEAHQKLQGCIDSMKKEYPSLKVQELFLLDCREPASAGIQGLRSYLQQTQPIGSTSISFMYNVHWVMAQLQKAFSDKQSIQLSTFREWLQDNAQNLPSHLLSPEDVCQDLSAAGYILFLHNKHDPSQSWLVLDLQTILHNVYGTLFSPSRAMVNQFGLLHFSHLSKLFPKLDPKMIQEVLITLEYCINVDPLNLKEEVLILTEQDKGEGWLYFPALVTAEVCEVFPPDPQCLHWTCWQLKTDFKYIILAHLLQGILLHLAATHAFIEEELPCSVRKHCCSVWVNGLSWRYTKGVDVAVQISDNSTVEVIGRSREGPGELYRYMSSITQSIFKTIAKLSPALKATPYIIHPYTYDGLDKSRSAPRTTHYPVASIVRSIKAGHKYVHSLPISSGSGSDTASLNELFGGWSPSLTVVKCLKEAKTNPCVEDTDSPRKQLPQFAVITANGTEQNVVKHYLKLSDPGLIHGELASYDWTHDPFLKKKEFKIEFCDKVQPVYEVFTVGKVTGVHVKCARNGPDGAFETTCGLLKKAIKDEWHLKVIFVVGCCGVSMSDAKKKQPGTEEPMNWHGTVLLSDQAYNYLDAGKFVEGTHENTSGAVVGTTLEISTRTHDLSTVWLNRLGEIAILKPVVAEGSYKNIPVEKVAKYLSGPLLMKSQMEANKIRGELCAMAGIEMEVIGVLRAVHSLAPMVDVALVKGISDYGDSGKNAPAKSMVFGQKTEEAVGGEVRQEIATFHAITLVIRCVANNVDAFDA